MIAFLSYQLSLLLCTSHLTGLSSFFFGHLLDGPLTSFCRWSSRRVSSSVWGTFILDNKRRDFKQTANDNMNDYMI